MTADQCLEVGAAAAVLVLGGLFGVSFVLRFIRSLFTAASS